MKKIPKKTVLRTIQQDLSTLRVIWGLNLLGFKSNESHLSTSWLIFAFMGLNTDDLNNSHLQEEYSERAYQVIDLAANDSEAIERLSIEIYNWLSDERRKYKKRRLI